MVAILLPFENMLYIIQTIWQTLSSVCKCFTASSIRPMCSQFEATVTEGFLSTTKYPTWAPKTDRNCNCWLQPIGGHVTVQVVNYYYSPGPGESENGFNLTARWGSGWPIRIKGVSDSRYVNYTLANRTTERVHLQLLNEGISVGILWLHFIGEHILLFYKAT